MIQVLDKAFDVLVQRYGVIKRVYCEVLWYIRETCYDGFKAVPTVLERSGRL